MGLLLNLRAPELVQRELWGRVLEGDWRSHPAVPCASCAVVTQGGAQALTFVMQGAELALSRSGGALKPAPSVNGDLGKAYPLNLEDFKKTCPCPGLQVKIKTTTKTLARHSGTHL